MIAIKRRISLLSANTFRLDVRAENFVVVASKDDLIEAIAWAKYYNQDIFVLGGGSNILLTKALKGLVIKNEIKGAAIIKTVGQTVFVTANAGENWTEFIDFCLDRGLAGLENLYLIPGTVGAAPVQNIGAYGVEVKDLIDSVVALDLKTGRTRIFNNADCAFAYRDSVFKKKYRGRYFIYQVTFRLSKQPDFKLDYGDIRPELEKQRISVPTLKQMAAVIAQIRRAKLPDPQQLPNAGSFFKNPTITAAHFKKLQKLYPDIKGFPSGAKIKIPAGWLIEQAGFKGQRFGAVGVHDRQALIIVNYSGRSAAPILALDKKIKAAIKKKFAIELEEEVNII
jgi:UDP-N-acetylmuramate dehydrogenase